MGIILGQMGRLTSAWSRHAPLGRCAPSLRAAAELEAVGRIVLSVHLYVINTGKDVVLMKCFTLLVVVVFSITSCMAVQTHESQMTSTAATPDTARDMRIVTPTKPFLPRGIPTPKVDRIPQVVVYTDKLEYHQGSTITIAVRNETDYPIWYFGGQRFWGLERLNSNGHWVEVNFSFPVRDPHTGTDVCIYVRDCLYRNGRRKES